MDSRQAQTACKMPPRRLQMSKGLSPLPEGPGPKPVRPKRVKNAAEDSVRQAKFESELAAWQVAHKEHAELMKIRKRKTTAAWKAAQKGAKKVAPPPATPPAAPPPLQGWFVNDSLGLRIPFCFDSTSSPADLRPAVRFPGLRRDIVRWFLEVEAVARACGADEASPAAQIWGTHPAKIFNLGCWYNRELTLEGVPDFSPPKSRLITCARAAVQNLTKWGTSTSKLVDIRRTRPNTARSS